MAANPNERNTMYRKNSWAACPDIDGVEWAAWIEDEYGVTLGTDQLYADVDRNVYAGSEYVARLGDTLHPEDATRWADTINHMPRYGTGMEVARRRAS